MSTYKLKSGNHHYRDADGEVKVLKAGKTITCEPELLGGAISRFEEVDGKKSKLEKNAGEEKKPKKKFVRTKE